MRILGISCYFHDAAACLYDDGVLVAAAEEERFTRVKHDSRFPSSAIGWCIEQDRAGRARLDYVAYHEKPLLKLDRILKSCVDGSPTSLPLFLSAMRQWLSEKLWLPATIASTVGSDVPVLFVEHHLSHAASAYLTSPFPEAAVVTADGVGEWATATLGHGRGSALDLHREIRFPHSIGLLYSVITAHLGFEVNEGEYKVMGLAAYGKPTRLGDIGRLLDRAEDGSFRLDMRYFRYHRSLEVRDPRLDEVLGPPRHPEGPIEQGHADLAASLQVVLEDAVVAMAMEAQRATGSCRLAFAGGVALNVLANRAILRRTAIRELYIPPAPGDSGAAVGAAAYVYHTVLGRPRTTPWRDARLGPSYSPEEIAEFVASRSIEAERLGEDELLDRVADMIAQGKVVGWFEGRMEFGPRALGGRSILADPRDPAMKDVVNGRIKHRESFRPFAPAVALDAVPDLFEEADESPFMLLVSTVRPERRSQLGAVTHEDGTARLQTVTAEGHPRLHALIRRVARRTGVPAVLNTSFNVRGEPIVCSPEDAHRTFSATDLDALVLWPFLIGREGKRDWRPRIVAGAERGAPQL